MYLCELLIIFMIILTVWILQVDRYNVVGFKLPKAMVGVSEKPYPNPYIDGLFKR